MSPTKTLSILQAMAASLFWGFGFTATIWSLHSFSILQVLFLRFAIVGLCGTIWITFKNPALFKTLLVLTLIPSLFLLMELLFQVWGMQFTTATNAGFITATYVVIIPCLEKIIKHQSVRHNHWLWVAVALVGVLLMVRIQSLSFQLGDLLIFISVLGASFHVLAIDRLGKTDKNLFLTNTMQSVWGALIVLPFLLMKSDPWVMTWDLKSWLGLASLTFGSTMLAFYFQLGAQKKLSPSVSSLIFLIESPLSAAFGFTLLNESMDLTQWIGCVFILSAAAGVIWMNLKSENPNAKNTIAAEPVDT